MAGWSPEEGEAVFYRHLHGTVYPALPAAAWMSISLTASFLLFHSCILPGQIYIHIHRGGDLEMFVEKWNLKISSFFCRKHSMQLQFLFIICLLIVRLSRISCAGEVFETASNTLLGVPACLHPVLQCLDSEFPFCLQCLISAHAYIRRQQVMAQALGVSSILMGDHRLSSRLLASIWHISGCFRHLEE